MEPTNFNYVAKDSIISIPLPSKANANLWQRTVSKLNRPVGMTLIALSAVSQFFALSELLTSQTDPYEDYHRKLGHAVILPLTSFMNVALFTAGRLIISKKPSITYPKNCDDLHLIFKQAYEVIEEHKTLINSSIRDHAALIKACDEASETLKKIELTYYGISERAIKCSPRSNTCENKLPYQGYLEMVENAEKAAIKVIEDLAIKIRSFTDDVI